MGSTRICNKTLRNDDVPEGFATALSNCRFRPGSVESRPGLTPFLTKAGRTFLGLTQFVDNYLNRYLLTLDDLGNLDSTNSLLGTSSLLVGAANPGSLLKSASQFNSEYLAFFGPGTTPQGPIRAVTTPQTLTLAQQVLSPPGPGGKDHLASSGDILSGSPVISNVTQLDTWTVGDAIAAASGALTAGTNRVVSIDRNKNQLTVSVNATATVVGDTLFWGRGVSAKDDPTASGVGQVSVGLHGVAVSFITSTGYVTEPSAPVYWVAAGTKKVQVAGIPTGPAYVIGRQLYFTVAADPENFWFIQTFQINDNTTTSATLDFTDTDLYAGDSVNHLFDNFRLPDEAAVSVYNGRLVTWGGLNRDVVNATQAVSAAYTNDSFNGGLDSDGIPMGWEARVTGGLPAHGAVDLATSFDGASWRITSDGGAYSAGEGVLASFEAHQRTVRGTQYSVRVRLRRAGGTSGTVKIGFVGTGVTTAQLTVPVATIPSDRFAEFVGFIGSLAADPDDLGLSIGLYDCATVGEKVWIDRLQVYPTAKEFESSVLRVSDPFNPDRFDATNGLIYVGKDDGQRIMACGQLRWYYYILKDHSMYVTFDDGSNPPSLWSVNKVDGVVGASGPNGITAMEGAQESEDFIAVAARAGAYIFFGGRPTKISQEIQDTWGRINWGARETIHILADPNHKVLSFHVPLDGATTPSHVLILDYVEGFGTEAEPGGRKWGIDTYPTPLRASSLLENDDNSTSLVYAGAKMYTQAGTTDDGVAIDSFYETSYARATPTGQSLFGGVSYTLTGNGLLKQRLLGLGDSPTVVLPDRIIPPTQAQDIEVFCNVESERLRVRIGVHGIDVLGVGHSFSLRRLAIFQKPWARSRPH